MKFRVFILSKLFYLSLLCRNFQRWRLSYFSTIREFCHRSAWNCDSDPLYKSQIVLIKERTWDYFNFWNAANRVRQKIRRWERGWRCGATICGVSPFGKEAGQPLNRTSPTS